MMVMIKTVLAGIAAATAVAGGVMAARAQREMGTQQQRVHEFNASISDRNERISELNAASIQRVSDVENDAWQRRVNQLKGQQAMAFGKLGWEMSGTPGAVMAHLANEISQERATRDYNVAVARDSKIEEGVEARLQSQLHRAAGEQARFAGETKAGASLLGTATTLAKWAYGA